LTKQRVASNTKTEVNYQAAKAVTPPLPDAAVTPLAPVAAALPPAKEVGLYHAVTPMDEKQVILQRNK